MDRKIIFIFVILFFISFANAATIDLSWIYPTANSDVSQNHFFNISALVSCIDVDCGAMNISLNGGTQNSITPNPANGTTVVYADGLAVVQTGNDQIDYINITANADGTALVYIRWYFSSSGSYSLADGVHLKAFYNDSGVWKDVYSQVFHSSAARVGDGYVNARRLLDTWYSENFTINLTTSGNKKYLRAAIIDRASSTDLMINNYSCLACGTTTDSSRNFDNVDITFNITGGGSNIISKTIGATPFYTNVTNPYNLTLSDGQSETITWWVNATGAVNTNNSISIYANLTANESINNKTSSLNLSIKDVDAPLINITYPLNITYTYNVSSINYTYLDFNAGSCWYSSNNGLTNFSIVNAKTNFTNVTSIDGNNSWTVYCNDSSGNTIFQTVNFSKQIPQILLNMISPLWDINATHNDSFFVIANISCANGNCGAINVTLDPPAGDFAYCGANCSLCNQPGTVVTDSCDATSNADCGGNGADGYFFTNNIRVNGSFTPGGAITIVAELDSGYAGAYFVTGWQGNKLMNQFGCFDSTDDYCSGYTSLNFGDNRCNLTFGAGYNGSESASFGTDTTINVSALTTTPYHIRVTYSYAVECNSVTTGNGYSESDGDFCEESSYGENDGINITLTSSSSKGGAISMVEGTTPFYTNVTNPYNLTLSDGQSETITWWVNATGQPGNNYTFFVYANMTSDPSINNITAKWNVSIVNFSVDYTVPSVSLRYPNDSAGGDENMTFNYIVTDTNDITSCSLILDSETNRTTSTISKSITQSFSLINLVNKSYVWAVNCTDNYGNIGNSEVRNITIVKASKFSGYTTNLSLVDINNISNFIIEDSNYGRINFSQNVSLSSGADINNYINISFNRIEVNSTALPQLNKTVKLKLYNLTFTNPKILKDGVDCPSSICTKESYSGNTLTFNATGFSVYSAGETEEETATNNNGGGGGGGGGSGGASPSILCYTNWTCTKWSFCSANLTQTRFCYKENEECIVGLKPIELRMCPDILFDIKVDLAKETIMPWNDLKVIIDMKEINKSELVDVEVIYKISNEEGVVWEEKETKAIIDSNVYIKKLDNLELPAGTYLIQVVINYGKNQTASAFKPFKIIGWKSLFIYLIVLIALILFGIIAYNKYKERKDEDKIKEYIEKADVNEIIEKKKKFYEPTFRTPEESYKENLNKEQKIELLKEERDILTLASDLPKDEAVKKIKKIVSYPEEEITKILNKFENLGLITRIKTLKYGVEKEVYYHTLKVKKDMVNDDLKFRKKFGWDFRKVQEDKEPYY
ncbi:MAG: hypothetical protein WC533_01425 [Candidatus Pacearchaeota archaeon]